MTANQDRNQIGEQIRAAVQEGLTTGDFRQFNTVVNHTVSQAIKDSMTAKAQKQSEHAAQQNTAQQYTHPAYARAAQKKQEREQQELRQKNQQELARQNRTESSTQWVSKPKTGTRIRMNKVGNVAAVLYMTFGGIGMGVTGILLVVFLAMILVTGSGIPAAIAGGLFAGFFAMVRKGCSKRNLLKRAWRYIELCGTRSYINIEDLAAHTGKSRREILKDVRKMIRMNIYPEGHLDSSEKCLMLTDATFQEYLNLDKERRRLELEQKTAGNIEQKEPKTGPSGRRKGAEEQPQNPELAAMMQEGKEYIRKLREMNDAIPGEVISQKLFRLERLLQEIFERVEEHPEQMPQMQKFMNYYLPTTLKLVEAYAEFDAVSVQGEEILEAKKEIEATLDTINKAFAELLNKLFTATVYDVTTDAQVLQTMLSKDGLMGNEVLSVEEGSETDAK